MSLRRASAVVILGSALGFGINLLLTPVLSRLYSPGAFGLFATVIAVATSLVGVSTLRLEVRAQSSGDDSETRTLFRCALVAAGLCSLVAGLVAVVAVLLGAPLVWLSTPLVVLAGSLQIVGAAMYVRRQRYRDLGVANFLQGAGTGAVQVSAGAVSPHVHSLVLGFLVARLTWLGSMRGLRGPSGGLWSTWLSHRRYAVVAGASAGVNSVAGQLIVILPAFFGGVAVAGALAMAIRLLVSPLGIIAQGVSSATVGEVGRRLRDGVPSVGLVDKAVRDLLVVGLLPCAGAAVLGPLLAPVVLGEEWAQTGTLLALLAPGALAQFVGSPLGQLLNVAGASRSLLRWDILRLATIAVALVTPLALGRSVAVAVGAYSVGQVALYVVLVGLVRRVLRRAS